MSDTKTKLRSMILNTDEVRAVQAGVKTAHVLPANFSDIPGDTPNMVLEVYPGEWIAWWTDTPAAETLKFTRERYKPGDGMPCPLGSVGDMLYVREKVRIAAGWIGAMVNLGVGHGLPIYAADYDQQEIEQDERDYGWLSEDAMPDYAARLYLQIESIIVKRAHDVDDDEAAATGIAHSEVIIDPRTGEPTIRQIRPVEEYARVFEEKHGADAWDRNDWLWLGNFKQVPKPSCKEQK